MKLIALIFSLLFLAQAQAADLYYDFTAGVDANVGSEASPRKNLSKLYSDLQLASCGDRFFLKRGETWISGNSTARIFVNSKPCAVGTKIVVDAYGSGDLPIIVGTNLTDVVLAVEVRDSSWIEVKNIRIESWNSALAVLGGSSDILVQGVQGENFRKEAMRVARSGGTPTRVTFDDVLIDTCGNGATNGEGIYVGTDSVTPEDTSNNVTIQNSEITNCEEAVEIKPGAHTITITGNNFHGNDDTGSTTGVILIQRSTSTPAVHTNAIISYNRIYDNTSVDNTHDGIRCRGECSIFGNLIHDNQGDGVQVQDVTPDGYARLVYNNTIEGNAGACVTGSGSGYAQRNNICWNNGSGNDATDPSFTDAANDNFSLLSTSNRIDAGSSCDLAFNGASCEPGAYETIHLPTGECNVQTATPTVITCPFNNNLHSPLAASNFATGWTAKKDGSNNVITAADATVNSIAFTVTSAFALGDSCSVSYVSATGNLTDSSPLAIKQKFHSVTDLPCTNYVDQSPTATLTQLHGRCFNIYSTLTVPTWRSAENVNCQVMVGGYFAVAISVGGTVADPLPLLLVGRFNLNGGGYAVVTNDVATDKVGFAVHSTSSLANAQVISTTLNTNPHATFLAGEILADASNTLSVDLTQDSATQVLLLLKLDSSVSVGDVFCFRIYESDGTPLDAYTNTPCVTVISPLAGL